MDKKLKYLKEAWELMELFKPQPYTWIDEESISFTIDNFKYNANLEDLEENIFYVDFGIMKKGKYDTKSTLNSVDATDVLATVFNAVIEIADKETDLTIMFSPTKDKNEKSEDSKRFSLYKRFSERLSKQPEFPFNFQGVSEEEGVFSFKFTPKMNENKHYSADPINASPNRLVNYVPFAVLSDHVSPFALSNSSSLKALVAENPSGGFYGYDTIEQAIQRIQKAKKLHPAWKDIKNFQIREMSGKEHLRTFDENGNQL
jgi:hypothetical protein